MELKIITLNCWGLAVISKNRQQRMKAIAKMLAASNYDIVCLQELWSESDYQFIKETVKTTLPYSHYFYSGVVGSGICAFSKYEFDEVFFHQWPVNGYIHKIQHGDWFGGKGVGLCRLKINTFHINIYLAHLHAEYHRNCNEYQAHRVLQAFNTAQFIRLTSKCADLVIFAGDLNTEPDELAYSIIMAVPGLKDSYMAADESMRSDGATYGRVTNFYTPKKSTNENVGQRIDYIMYHNNSTELTVKQISYNLPLPPTIPDYPFSYSDHEAVSATFYLEKLENSNILSECTTDYDPQQLEEVLNKSIAVCDKAMKDLRKHKYGYYFFAFILLILLIVTIIFNPPYEYLPIYHLLKICLTIVMVYVLIMATAWNRIEVNAIRAAKLAMEISLERTKKCL